MSKKRRKLRMAAAALIAAAALAVLTVSLASCGGSGSSGTSGTTTKLPPGVDEGTVAENPSPTATSAGSQPAEGSGEQTGEDQEQAAASTSSPNRTADLAGARFTVVGASRPDSNKSVVSSGGREVAGDYLEVELTVQNVGTDLIDLSDYSFRLTSPGIAADTYPDYYGETGTYGAYIDENEISASLLSYSDLAAVTYVMKIGESVDEVFLFFDLNPENVARNSAVTKDNSTLVIRKVSGSDYGDEVTVPLAGYAD